MQEITERFGAARRLVVLLGPAEDPASSPVDRRRDGRRLIAQATSRLLGVDAEAVVVTARCERCGGDHGLPSVTVSGRPHTVGASVSHAGGRTVVAVADGAVGVDAEPIAGSADRFAAIRSISGSWGSDAADGADVLGVWTAIESVVKADGRGLEIDPGRVRVTGGSGDAMRTGSIDGRRPFYAVSSADVDGLVVSVALEAAAGTG